MIDRSIVPKDDVQIYYKSKAFQPEDSLLTSEKRFIEVNCGEVIDFISDVHGSVGISFDLDYDTAFFEVTEYEQYYNPKEIEMGMCGADRAVKIYKVKTIQKGTSKVRCIEGFRGSIANEIEYTIIVK